MIMMRTRLPYLLAWAPWLTLGMQCWNSPHWPHRSSSTPWDPHILPHLKKYTITTIFTTKRDFTHITFNIKSIKLLIQTVGFPWEYFIMLLNCVILMFSFLLTDAHIICFSWQLPSLFADISFIRRTHSCHLT